MDMTLSEKIAFCSGTDFWHTKDYSRFGIPSMMMCDGPNGLRRQQDAADMLGVNESLPATCFPTEALTACSFDEALLSEIGQAIASEAADQGVGMVLGPGANTKRNPLCGRNFEYFSEDPYLSGKLAAAYVRGVQSTGIVSTLKHFACNSQEYKRFSSDSILDERTLREMYLRAFEIAVKEGKPGAVMCAYNKLNGEHCSDSRKLLTDILRTEWGFDGMVVTDWGAMNSRIRSFQAGCDLCMPGGSAYQEKEAEMAVRCGVLHEEDIDLSVERIRRTVTQGLNAVSGFSQKRSGLPEGTPCSGESSGILERRLCSEKTEPEDLKSSADRSERLYREHFNLAARAAQESAVLLKNERGALPLASFAHTVFIGSLAGSPRYQGAGSSHINPWKLESPLEACKGVTYVPGYREDGSTDEKLIWEALKTASSAESVVVFAGLPASYESEGFDRENMKLPEGMNRLIRELSSGDRKLIVVLYSGSAVELPWADEADAILYMGLPGEAGGMALKRLLLGQAVPCGKLAESWPVRYEDVVSSSCYGHGRKDAEYRESIYVGYRYYSTAHAPVRYPFGYGLSYTEFAYSDLKIEGRDITCTVTNVGKAPAKEIVQLYLQPPQTYRTSSGKEVFRPALELCAFDKIRLQPGESAEVHFHLDDRSFAVWDDGWIVPEGTYTVKVGGSSENLPLQAAIQAGGERLSACRMKADEDRRGGSAESVPEWYRNPQGKPSLEDFEQLTGRKIEEKPARKGSFTMDNTVMEMKDHSFIMNIMYKAVKANIAKGFHGRKEIENDPTFRMMLNSAADASLSAMKINGGMKNHVLEGMLEMANGHFLKGIGRMIRS